MGCLNFLVLLGKNKQKGSLYSASCSYHIQVDVREV